MQGGSWEGGMCFDSVIEGLTLGISADATLLPPTQDLGLRCQFLAEMDVFVSQPNGSFSRCHLNSPVTSGLEKCDSVSEP